MKVLITGGCGFIGSHVAERFYKEGHKIYIIDNLSTGDINNLKVDNKFYELDISSKKCEEVFKTNKFDVVINLAAQVDVNNSFQYPYVDSRTNILGITNMLDLSQKYGVKKFIFASSAEVLGDTKEISLKEENIKNANSPYAMSKTVGEFYCQKWNDIYGLKTVCLRLSNVYGPRQGKNNVVSTFIEKCIQNERITIFGDGQQTRDFIYVEDLADAIYKAYEKDVTGVLNVSTDTEVTINRLIDTLKVMHSIDEISYKEAREGEKKKSRLDNTKAKELLGWSPKYSFKDGVEKTYNWYNEYYKASYTQEIDTSEKRKKEKIKAIMLKGLPYFENIAVILLIMFFSLNISKDRYAVLSSPLDLCFLYIIVMSIIYGIKQALLSISLSSIWYLYLLLSSGADVVTLIYEPKHIVRIVFYIIIGSVIGYNVDLNKRKLYINELEVEGLKEKYEFIEALYDDTRIINEQLEKQIISSRDSFANIYNTTKALNSVKFDEIYGAAINIVEDLLKTTKVAIYFLTKNSDYLRLRGKSSKEQFELPFSICINDFPEIKNLIQNKKIYVNKTFEENLPIMMAPVIDEERDKVVAVICIYKLQFENMTLYYQNLFKVLVDLISNSITKAYKFDEVTAKDKYLPGTEILIPMELKSLLEEKSKNPLGIDYAIIRVETCGQPYESLYYKIASCVRDSDVIGMGEDNRIYIILSSANSVSAKNVAARLDLNNIKAELIEG